MHVLTVEDVAHRLATDCVNGLKTSDVVARREEYGANILPEVKKKHLAVRFFAYFKDLLSVILMTAAVLSLAIGEYKDGVVIVCIVFANAVLGLVQESKADNALAALKKLSVTQARVIRDGVLSLVDASDLVPGDLIVLENGDKIPADARLVEAVHLKVSESSFTGESRPVDKNTAQITLEQLTIGERANMVYKDTIIVFGRGKAIVTAIGVHTEIGKIYQLLQKHEKKTTALSLELERVGKGLTIFAAVAAGVIFVSTVLSDSAGLRQAFLTAISMAVAVVPEGIPAVVTTVLAFSVVRLARAQAIIRKLSAVETLGSATYILTDKTGTLTKNEMMVTDIFDTERHFKVNDDSFVEGEKNFDPLLDNKIRWLLYCAVLCNDAKIAQDSSVIGDPTETSLLVLARKAGMDVEKIRAEYRRVFELPFSSETKRMIVVVEGENGKKYAFAKGAPEAIEPLLREKHVSLSINAAQLSQSGVRNLAYSYKEITRDNSVDDLEKNILYDHDYLGIIGKKDPLRPDVKEAVAQAREAGVRTLMITGDHRLIAYNIGSEIGIVEHAHHVMDGAELAAIPQEQYRELVKNVRAFARVSPEQKLLITRAVMENGETVIVTGDGVNDAPAIKTADIGVAMGIAGTDVAKEAADMVLQNDNYSTIVEAVRQGRSIFNNFVKFLRYQISCNVSGVLIMFPIIALNLPAPLLPVHILLLNLVSETGPSIALGLEKPEKTVMTVKPRLKNERLLTRSRWYRILAEAFLLAGAGIAIFFVTQRVDAVHAPTAVLVTAFLSRLWHAFSSRSENLSAFSSNLTRNYGLYYTVIGTLGFLLLSVYTSIGNTLFKTIPLDRALLVWCLFFSLIPFILIESYKAFVRKEKGTSG